jgi:hypothetical protein
VTPGDDRREFTIRLPRLRKPGKPKRPRLPRSKKGIAAALLAVAIAGAGVWFFAIRDTGPTQAEIEAKEQKEAEAAALAAAQAELSTCQTQVGALLTAERDLESLLNGVGLNFDEYSDKVGEISVAYGAVPIGSLSPQCLGQVGVHAEKAMNEWVKAGEIWNECVGDLYCDDDSIDPERQVHWLSASGSLQKATDGMAGLGQP